MYVEDVAPDRAAPFLDHWYTKGAEPLADTEKVAPCPLSTDWLCGCVAIVGPVADGVDEPEEPPPHPTRTQESAKANSWCRAFRMPRMPWVPRGDWFFFNVYSDSHLMLAASLWPLFARATPASGRAAPPAATAPGSPPEPARLPLRHSVPAAKAALV